MQRNQLRFLALHGLMGVGLLPLAMLVLAVASPARAGDIPATRLRSAIPVPGKQFAFVFDDGPVPNSTQTLLAALKHANMRATFSLVGKQVNAYPELARQIISEGHEIATLTWSNTDLTVMTDEQVRSEIEAGYQVIVDVTGVKPQYLRPPVSRTSIRIEQIAASLGLEVLMHSLDSGDWREPPPGEVTELILNGITPGAIVLAHESFPKSVREMPGIIDRLASRGFRSYTVSELKGQTGGGSVVTTAVGP